MQNGRRANGGLLGADKLWYHGSPLKLSKLASGSTITRDPHLARIFSHKPTIVSLGDDGTLKHDGREGGYLYAIDEILGEGDFVPHPRSAMGPGIEWLTKRPLMLALVDRTRIRPEEQLSFSEVVLLRLRAMLRRLRASFSTKRRD
jgi:hypothetical protein